MRNLFVEIDLMFVLRFLLQPLSYTFCLEERYDTHTLIYVMLSSNVQVAPDQFFNMKFILHVIPYTATATVIVSYAHTICTAY